MESRAVYRCFVYPTEKGTYVAKCIDLCLAAEADTPDAACASLREAMEGCIETALEGDTRGLLPRRKSPLSTLITYYAARAVVGVTSAALALLDIGGLRVQFFPETLALSR